jgi:RNA polymerase sigma-70 factor, ECF subfamily
VQHVEDEELIDEARKSSDASVRREILGGLFQRHHSKVILWCYRFSGNRDSAADLAQEIFVKAYVNLDSFQQNSKFSTWLYTVTMNHCRDNADKPAVRKERLSKSLTNDIPRNDRFDLRLEREQEFQVLRQLMCSSLSEMEQKVLMLHYGEEMKLNEVTRLLGLENPSGAKAHIVNARRKLATALDRWRQRGDRRRRNL